MTRPFTLLVLLAGVTSVTAPQAQVPQPTFAVASVKPSTADTQSSRPGAFLPGGHFVAQNASLLILIHRAYPEYARRPDGIVGPMWLQETRFDVDAKADRDAPYSEMLVMLRRLLAERFGLRVHTETQQRDGFALVRAQADGRLGPGLRPTQATCTSLTPVAPTADVADLPMCALHRGFANGLSTASFRGARMTSLALLVESVMARGVVDHTNLTGSFDIDLSWVADEVLLAAPGIDTRPGMATALQEQLGLKLERTRTPLEVLVVDAVQRPKAN